jgi:hypothetical protein
MSYLFFIQVTQPNSLTQGCIQSIRAFYPDAPIRLISDSAIVYPFPLDGNTVPQINPLPGSGWFGVLQGLVGFAPLAPRYFFLDDTVRLNQPFLETNFINTVQPFWYDDLSSTLDNAIARIQALNLPPDYQGRILHSYETQYGTDWHTFTGGHFTCTNEWIQVFLPTLNFFTSPSATAWPNWSGLIFYTMGQTYSDAPICGPWVSGRNNGPFLSLAP